MEGWAYYDSGKMAHKTGEMDEHKLESFLYASSRVTFPEVAWWNKSLTLTVFLERQGTQDLPA